MHASGGGKGFLAALKGLGALQKVALSVAAVVVVGGATAVTVSVINNNNNGIGTDGEISSGVSSDVSSDTSSVSSATSSASSATSSASSDTSSASSDTSSASSDTSSASSDTSSASSDTSSASSATSSASSAASSSSSEETSSTESAPPDAAAIANLPEGYQERFADLYKANSDIIGWIKLSGTKLDYPVAKTTDNSYYLNRNIYKQSYVWGVPYMNCYNSIGNGYRDQNLILYGHSDDKKGLQLSALKGYRKIDFYKQHPTIQFDTVYEDATYKVIALFIENTTPGTDFFPYHMFTNAASDDDFNNFIDNVKLRSYINTTVDVLPTDELLTISTCEDTNTANYNRLVTVARKVRPGESTSVDTSGATQNSNQLLP